MHIAFILFDQMTALDFVGAYDPITRLRSMELLPGVSWHLCSYTEGITDDRGLRFVPERVRVSLAEYDVLVVPGGFGTRTLQIDTGFMNWLHTADRVPMKASVCTGALLMGAAGWLTGRPATTHPRSLEALRRYTDAVVTDRVVDAGDVVTAGGVTAAIDLGLHLVSRLAGPAARDRVARQMDYIPAAPPAVRRGQPGSGKTPQDGRDAGRDAASGTSRENTFASTA